MVAAATLAWLASAPPGAPAAGHAPAAPPALARAARTEAARRITATEFLERLSKARRHAEAATAAPAPARMLEVRRIIGFPLVVELPGAAVSVGGDPALDALGGGTASEFQHAAAHLRALEEAAHGALAAERLDRERLRRTLAASYPGIRARPGLASRVQRALADFLAEAIAQLVRGGAASVVAWIVVAAVVLGGLLLLRRLAIVPERRARARSGAGAPVPADWGRAAEEALARGDLSEAVRALYRILLGALSARGVVSDAPSLTAGECRRAVGAALPAASVVVDRATWIFERTAYGRRAPTREDVDAVRDAGRAVTAA